MIDLLNMILTNWWPFIGAVILILVIGEAIATAVAAFRKGS